MFLQILTNFSLLSFSPFYFPYLYFSPRVFSVIFPSSSSSSSFVFLFQLSVLVSTYVVWSPRLHLFSDLFLAAFCLPSGAKIVFGRLVTKLNALLTLKCQLDNVLHSSKPRIRYPRWSYTTTVVPYRASTSHLSPVLPRSHPVVWLSVPFRSNRFVFPFWFPTILGAAGGKFPSPRVRLRRRLGCCQVRLGSFALVANMWLFGHIQLLSNVRASRNGNLELCITESTPISPPHKKLLATRVARGRWRRIVYPFYGAPNRSLFDWCDRPSTLRFEKAMAANAAA